MKNFIVLAAILPLMLIFLLQFTLDQKNSANIGRFQEYVYTAKEQARQEGCFTEDIRRELKRKIAETFDISEAQVEITATDRPQYRLNRFDGTESSRGLIYYRVSVPLEKLMAGRRLFGIRQEENRGIYTIESWAASERLP